jgi:hypothetical protein
MIKIVHAHNGVMVNNFGSGAPYIVDDANDPSNGAVRYRGSNFEIYDSYNKKWVIHLGETINLTLDSRTHTLLNWVEAKMFEEQREHELLEKYPALRIAKDNYDTIKALVQNG